MILKWFILAILLSSCVHPRVYAQPRLKSINLRPFRPPPIFDRSRDHSYQNFNQNNFDPRLTPLDPRMVPGIGETPANAFPTNWLEIKNNVEKTSGFQANGGILNNGLDAPSFRPGIRNIGSGSVLPFKARLRAQQFGPINGGDSFIDSADSQFDGNIKNDGISTLLLSVTDVIQGRP
uniref:AlNc14C176G8132 protein n=1 Tax=Albugo laibachii Nc14 TaxID=890382 RepID=F0WNX7_9STRA|nr:AlNc14C176G8132 [Albugo laibachii Nc14]|eukprot:CCA23020.1 AlNc14C176G8132 [Albugo laibachii Nc14]